MHQLGFPVEPTAQPKIHMGFLTRLFWTPISYIVCVVLTGMNNHDYTLPPEKIAFIAYNIGVYETVQKFGESIIKGKITPNMDISRIAEVLSESYSFYDSVIISQIVNAMIRQNKESNAIIGNVTSKDVDQVMRQLKTCGISLP